MKDITSTSFGLTIAYMLPGMVGAYSLVPLSQPLGDLFKGFLTAPSNVGLFFVLALVSLTIGLQITAMRWIIYECVLCFRWKLTANDFALLNSDSKLAAFRAVVDEHYRYHQFWGGMSIALPCLYLSVDLFTNIPIAKACLLRIASFSLELVTCSAAIVAYKRYVTRAKLILKG